MAQAPDFLPAEEFLHYVWKHRNFNSANLKTTRGEPVNIIAVGEHNRNAGPDFSQAMIQIGDVVWSGTVEIHRKSSEWLAHGHQHDRAYGNVILHVVYQHDKDCPELENIPTLELKDKISAGSLERYGLLNLSTLSIPCGNLIGDIGSIHKNIWLDRVLIERLERKMDVFKAFIEQEGPDWSSLTYRYIARAMGAKVNGNAFYQLAERVPLSLIAKHKDNLFQLEALLYGTAGLIPKPQGEEDKYVTELRKEASFLLRKYSIQPLPPTAWNFGGIRPANHPTIRISQFASLLFTSHQLFNKLLVVADVKEMTSLFDVKASPYWESHYHFNKAAGRPGKRSLGKDGRANLVINTVLPILFCYAKWKKLPEITERVLAMMEKLPGEKNSIVASFEELGFSAESAGQTQALLQMNEGYCSKKRCLDCGIGVKILRGGLKIAAD